MANVGGSGAGEPQTFRGPTCQVHPKHSHFKWPGTSKHMCGAPAAAWCAGRKTVSIRLSDGIVRSIPPAFYYVCAEHLPDPRFVVADNLLGDLDDDLDLDDLAR